MKKWSIALLAVLMIFSMAACRGNRIAERLGASSAESASSARSDTDQAPSRGEASSTVSGSSAANAGNPVADEVNSTLEDLKNLTGSLDDVTSDDMSIPNP